MSKWNVRVPKFQYNLCQRSVLINGNLTEYFPIAGRRMTQPRTYGRCFGPLYAALT